MEMEPIPLAVVRSCRHAAQGDHACTLPGARVERWSVRAVRARGCGPKSSAVGGAWFAHLLLTTRVPRSFVVTGQRMIPQWDLGGTATAHRSFVRLTAEAQGSKGWMTCHQPLTLPEWSATLELRASGASPHLYGDGLAIWLTKASDHIEGPVFA